MLYKPQLEKEGVHEFYANSIVLVADDVRELQQNSELRQKDLSGSGRRSNVEKVTFYGSEQ